MALTDANDHFEHLNRSIHCRARSSVAVTVKHPHRRVRAKRTGWYITLSRSQRRRFGPLIPSSQSWARSKLPQLVAENPLVFGVVDGHYDKLYPAGVERRLQRRRLQSLDALVRSAASSDLLERAFWR